MVHGFEDNCNSCLGFIVKIAFRQVLLVIKNIYLVFISGLIMQAWALSFFLCCIIIAAMIDYDPAVSDVPVAKTGSRNAQEGVSIVAV